MANLLFSILSTFNDKGLKKASKQVSLFEKQTKSLQAVFLKTFSAIALLNYSKKAVNAFMADERAAKSLEIQLKNTGFEFASPYVEYYIANLQKLTGVLDDHLRPAFQTLLTATGSITESQKALQVALDTSAATGMSLEEVTSALSAGYRGQTKSLRSLGVTLSKSALAAGNMGIALEEISKAYSGQAAARLDTYAGKMDKLKVISADASEIIGKGLLDALTAVGKNQSLDKFGEDVNKTATAISYLVGGVAKLVAETNKLVNVKFGSGSALDFILRNLPVVSAYYNAGKGAAASTAAPNIGGYSGIPSVTDRIKMQEDTARKKLITSMKAEEALKKLKDKYDVERIGLMAALNFATDDATKLKIAEKLAILDGNAAKAGEYIAANKAAKAIEELATATKPATDAFIAAATKMGAVARGEYSDIYNPKTPSGGGGGGGGGGGFDFPSQAVSMGGVSRGEYSGDVYVSVNGSILAAEDLTDTITDTILRINKMGRGTTPAGGLSGGT